MTLQEEFEHEVFAQYFLSTIGQNEEGWLVSNSCKHKDEFLVKTDDGTYLDPTLNSAWWAWQRRGKVDFGLPADHRPFITGSRRYGSPSEHSDTDLVLLVDQSTFTQLYSSLSDGGSISQGELDTKTHCSLSAGNLNLIVTTDVALYLTWVEGTDILENIAPVGREEAKELFQTLRTNIGHPPLVKD